MQHTVDANPRMLISWTGVVLVEKPSNPFSLVSRVVNLSEEEFDIKVKLTAAYRGDYTWKTLMADSRPNWYLKDEEAIPLFRICKSLSLLAT